MTRAENLERLKQANRQLRAQVRQLRKQLQLVQSELALVQQLWADDISDLKKQRRKKIETKRVPVCPQCGNPTLDVQTIGVWILERCSACDHFDRRQTDANH